MKNLFTKIKDFKRNKRTPFKYSRGMTYVELIVVLSIFSIISSVSLFNYRKFEEKVDMKSLANDIALKIVEAQKNSTSGVRPSSKTPADPTTWKPSYGVYFNPALLAQAFDFFVDLDQGKSQGGSIACTGSSNRECLQIIRTPAGSKSARITGLNAYYVNVNATPTALQDVHITYTRPDSVATFFSNTSFTLGEQVAYVEILLSSPQGAAGRIKVYSSGRIQIN